MKLRKNIVLAFLLFSGWIPVAFILSKLGLISSTSILTTEIVSSLTVAMIVGGAHLWKSTPSLLVEKSQNVFSKPKSEFDFVICLSVEFKELEDR